MRKYLIISFVITSLIIGGFFVVFFTDFYLPIESSINTFVKTSGKKILLNDKEFEINAISLNSNEPYKDHNDYSISKDTYKDYFKMISEMGLNTIRVYNIESPEFYKALKEYNKNNKNKLYLVQGTDAGNYEKNSDVSYIDKELKNDLIKNVKTMVDVIHGRKIIMSNNEYASGYYFTDVSEYVIGYLIGTEWNEATIAYTNNQDKIKYDGKYVKVRKQATNFEVVLANVLDELIKYESYKYGEQRLVSFGNEPNTDPFTYNVAITDFFNKYVNFDIANIELKDNVKSGMFASFQVYRDYPDFLKYDSEVDKDSYLEYLERLNKHYKIPVVISEFGYSTSRGTTSITRDEITQGNDIVDCIKIIKESGINNYIIYEWTDDWQKSIWNTLYGTDTVDAYLWNNVLTSSEGYGLYTYDVLIDGKKMILDGKTNDWKKSDLIYKDKERKLYSKYDSNYIYFMVEGNLDNKLYIPLDITNESGSNKYKDISFNRNIDFIIEIDKDNESNIFVQEYYNSLRGMYGKKVYGHDQFERENIPKKNSSSFDSILMLTGLQILTIDKDTYLIDNKATTINIGKLIYGTNNTKSSEFNSLSDYYIKDNVLEIRIPWQLINFYDPSENTIYDDYYKHYGIEEKKVKSIYAGVGISNKIDLSEIKLKRFKSFEYKGRLKSSYNIIKEYLRSGE